MNRALYNSTYEELNTFLANNPHMLELQFEISKSLAGLDNDDARILYLFDEMLDKFEILKSNLKLLEELLNEKN